ncbi:hypothetical protein DIPPA_21636 [Diplonema papillatum]|nr:hypothetical protein DIPPA_21636 [Diplonema papillatum]
MPPRVWKNLRRFVYLELTLYLVMVFHWHITLYASEKDGYLTEEVVGSDQWRYAGGEWYAVATGPSSTEAASGCCGVAGAAPHVIEACPPDIVRWYLANAILCFCTALCCSSIFFCTCEGSPAKRFPALAGFVLTALATLGWFVYLYYLVGENTEARCGPFVSHARIYFLTSYVQAFVTCIACVVVFVNRPTTPTSPTAPY